MHIYIVSNYISIKTPAFDFKFYKGNVYLCLYCVKKSYLKNTLNCHYIFYDLAHLLVVAHHTLGIPMLTQYVCVISHL